MDDDVRTLIKILKHKKRFKLADLLENSKSKIEESSQYGKHWNSIISSFFIYLPLDQYYAIKKISKKQQELLLEAILEIYPPAENSPEIRTIEYRILKEKVEKETKEISTYTPRTVRLFISYNDEDKKLAGEIKNYLEYFGLDVFVAHDDINPSLEWQEVIIQNLDSTDIFLPLITEHFQRSAWVDQETGIALTKNKLIIPISVNGFNPYGFIAKYQSLKLNNEDLFGSCIKIIKAIMDNKRFNFPLSDTLIKRLEKSGTFENTGKISKLLSEFNDLTKQQLEEIIRITLANDQVLFSFRAREYLQKILTKFKNLIDPEKIKELNQELESHDDSFRFDILKR